MESTRADVEPAVVRGCEVDAVPIRSFLRATERPRLAWGSATTTIAAGGTAKTVTASGPGRFDRIREASDGLLGGLRTVDAIPKGARPRLFGGFSFTDTHSEPERGSLWSGYPAAQFLLPAVQLTVTADGAWVTTAAVGEGANARATRRLRRWRDRIEALPELGLASVPGVSTRRYTPVRADWREQVESALTRIRRGDLRKVVLAQSLSADLDGALSPADLLARLGHSYPGCHRFLFEPEHGGTFFGATPERLVRVRERTVDTEALAGSIGRGDTTEEDRWLANQLTKSEKNTHEHDLVVEAIRDQLSALTTEIETGTRTVRKLANVQHLQTPIRATLSEERHVLSLVEALHPTPAVGGLPPDEARQTIRDTETFDRGWYAAPVGWIDADGNGTFAVAIRSAISDGSTATLFAGAGIVADSDPDEELDELQLKYRPILDELA